MLQTPRIIQLMWIEKWSPNCLNAHDISRVKPFWKMRRGKAVIALILLAVIGAVMGGAVVATMQKNVRKNGHA